MNSPCSPSWSRLTRLLNTFILHPLVCRSGCTPMVSCFLPLYLTITPPGSLPTTTPGIHLLSHFTLIWAPYPSHSVTSFGKTSVCSTWSCLRFLAFTLGFIFLGVPVISLGSTVSPNRLIAVHSSKPSAAYFKYSPGSPLSSGHSMVDTVAGCHVPGTFMCKLPPPTPAQKTLT